MKDWKKQNIYSKYSKFILLVYDDNIAKQPRQWITVDLKYFIIGYRSIWHCCAPVLVDVANQVVSQYSANDIYPPANIFSSVPLYH